MPMAESLTQQWSSQAYRYNESEKKIITRTDINRYSTIQDINRYSMIQICAYTAI